jgi:hypothetical protein
MTRAPGQIATTIYLPRPLYDWLKGRQVHEVDEYGRQLSMTRIIARYCQQARERIEQDSEMAGAGDLPRPSTGHRNAPGG